MATMARIEALAGAPLDQLREENVRRLVDDRISEAVDLDYKAETYGSKDQERRDLGGDVAAFANTVGGVLVLGVAEEDGAAESVAPIELSEAEELRIRQIVADTVFPMIQFTVHRVPLESDASIGFLLVVVPPSSQAPHAVAVGNGFRYPQRDGPRVRWLSESEIADQYRNRFRLAADQAEQVAEVMDEGLNSRGYPDAWLGIALVPNRLGQMRVSQAAVSAAENLLMEVDIPRLSPSTLHSHSHQASAGYRKIIVNLGQNDDGTPYGGVLHLYEDGAAFGGSTIGQPAQGPGNRLDLDDEWLVQEVIGLLAVAAHHAVNTCGASGDAAVKLTIEAVSPMVLRQGRTVVPRPLSDRALDELLLRPRTVSLDEVTGSPTGLLVAARLILTDVVNAFGVPELVQITEGGAVQKRNFQRHKWSLIDAECERLGLVRAE